jgi:opine dehydrogenase
MEIAVIGAGNGGKASAADLTLAGHQVNLFEFEIFKENIRDIQEKKGIELTGVGRNGFAKIKKVTTNIKEALENVDLILIVLPAFAHKYAAKICAPYLSDGQIIVLNPGSTLGSLEFLNEIRSHGFTGSISIGEVHTLTYATRSKGAEVRILLEVKKLWFAAFPGCETPKIIDKFKQLYPIAEPMRNILEVGLNNGNPVAHPGPALLNAGRVEFSKGEFYLYKEGITPSVAHLIEAIDTERLELCGRMGYKKISTLERLNMMGYSIKKTSLYEAYTTSPVFCGEHPIKGPSSLMDRYYVEDTAYGLVTWSSLGRLIGIRTPTIDSVVHLISILHKKDYFAQGARSLERFGLTNLTVEEINAFFDTGEKLFPK